jgi:hypothetical protein
MSIETVLLIVIVAFGFASVLNRWDMRLKRSLLLINQFAMSRTKASVHPPAAIPKTTASDT